MSWASASASASRAAGRARAATERLRRLLARLEAIHAGSPLDLVLMTGDITDAGRSAEWAEFLDILGGHPELAARTFILPGNHDLNVVDRANPARLELPTSPGKRLRQMRMLSAMEAVQGERVHVLDGVSGALAGTLSEALAPHRADIAAFADRGGVRLASRLERVWADVFPMLMPPATDDGLGVLMLNSNADAHFSFTNALGLVSAGQARGVASALRRFPRARWIVALHHHLVEYPAPAAAFSERIGTALINGSWFVRQLQPRGAGHGGDARPSAHRLDRRLRRASHRLRAVAGHGGDGTTSPPASTSTRWRTARKAGCACWHPERIEIAGRSAGD